MRTKLALIAVSGFAVSAVCLGGAFALGGNAIGNAVFDFGGFDLPRCDTSGPEPTASSRTLPWDGSDRAAVALAADTHYQAGSGDQLVIKGDPNVIAHVRVRNGVVQLDCHGGFLYGRHDRVDVTLPGRNFRSFEVLGTGDMQVAGLSQPEVKLAVTGSGTIEAEGKTQKMDVDVSGYGTIEAKGQTDKLNVDVSGSGTIKTGELAARNADLEVSGSGKIEVAPEDALNVDVSGSGTIYLKKEPKTIQTDISGSGHIVHPDGETQSRGHMRHARAEDAAIRDVINEAMAHDSDNDDLELAKARLKARIEARVAEELNRAKIGPDDN